MTKIYTILVCICLLAGFVACEKDKDFVLTKLMVQNETITPSYGSATIDCSFKADATISEAYVQYSLSSGFAKYDVAKMTEEKGKYVALLTDLQDNTTYYIRYAVSNKYSSVVTEEVVECQTLPCTVPTIVLDSIGGVRESHAKAYLHLTFDGGASVTDIGICWSKQSNPTIEDIHKSTKDTVAVLDMTDLQENTKYYVRAYAVNKVGTAYSEELVFTTESVLSEPTGTENGYGYVDLGLSVKWATMNVGANNPEEYGDYFAWGETDPKDSYYWTTYKYSNGSETTLTKYNTSTMAGTVDNKTTLELSDDAAYINWDGNWRMPSEAEWEELRKQCTWTWTTKNGVKGHKVTSKINDNNIFLPASGRHFVDAFTGVGVDGNYWSNTLNVASPCEAMYVLFISNGAGSFGSDRYVGHSVRPVLGEKVVELTPPIVTTSVATQITATTAVAGGNVISNGGAEVTERGVVYSTNPTPVITNLNNTIRPCGSGTGAFTYNMTGLQSGTTYYVRAYATNEVGTAYGEEVSFTTQEQSSTPNNGTENGYAYVDLGLSVKWATMNVGASSPEDYGDYFAWGETSTKSSYDWSTYKHCNGSATSLTKYNNSSSYGTVDNKTTLELSDDAARANWGSSWRMPTDAELTELRSNCIWTWTTQNGVNGYKVTSKSNGNSIFLPAAGFRYDSSLSSAGSDGNYWSSSLNTGYPYLAWDVYFNSGCVYRGSNHRLYGFTVRPVCP